MGLQLHVQDAVLGLHWVELPREESQWLPTTATLLLQHSTHSVVAGINSQGQLWLWLGGEPGWPPQTELPWPFGKPVQCLVASPASCAGPPLLVASIRGVEDTDRPPDEPPEEVHQGGACGQPSIFHPGRQPLLLWSTRWPRNSTYNLKSWNFSSLMTSLCFFNLSMPASLVDRSMMCGGGYMSGLVAKFSCL